jgi:hypothetical protein
MNWWGYDADRMAELREYFDADRELSLPCEPPATSPDWTDEDEDLWLDWCDHQQQIEDAQYERHLWLYDETGNTSLFTAILLVAMAFVLVCTVLGLGIARGYHPSIRTIPVEDTLPYANPEGATR